MAKNIKSKSKTNGWDFLTNVFVTAINKGQLVPICVFFLLFLLVAKLPSEKSYDLFKEIIDEFANYHFLGWIISILTTFGWIFNSRGLRRKFAIEMTRITEEKTVLHEKLIGKKMDSSGKTK